MGEGEAELESLILGRCMICGFSAALWMFWGGCLDERMVYDYDGMIYLRTMIMIPETGVLIVRFEWGIGSMIESSSIKSRLVNSDYPSKQGKQRLC